jgi:hypothetical protein
MSDHQSTFDKLVSAIRDEVRAEKFDAAGRIKVRMKRHFVLGCTTYVVRYSPEGAESNDDDIVEQGETPAEALGRFIMNHPELFPIEVDYSGS